MAESTSSEARAVTAGVSYGTSVQEDAEQTAPALSSAAEASDKPMLNVNITRTAVYFVIAATPVEPEQVAAKGHVIQVMVRQASAADSRSAEPCVSQKSTAI